MRRVVPLLVALVVAARFRRLPRTRTVDLDRVPRARRRGSTSSTTRQRAQPEGSPPPVTPESVDDMAALGVRTLYLQVVNPDGDAADVARRRASCSASSSRARTTPG